MESYFSTSALIVDDEIDTCYLLLTILKKKHIATHCINSLKAVEEILKKEKPTIIFLDNHLQDGNGIDFIDNLKKHCPTSKIVVITAEDTVTNRSKAILEGADYFISKPFTRDRIYNTIDLLDPTKKNHKPYL